MADGLLPVAPEKKGWPPQSNKETRPAERDVPARAGTPLFLQRAPGQAPATGTDVGQASTDVPPESAAESPLYDTVYQEFWSLVAGLAMANQQAPTVTRQTWGEQLGRELGELGGPGERSDAELAQLLTRAQGYRAQIKKFNEDAQLYWGDLIEQARWELERLEGRDDPADVKAREVLAREFAATEKRVDDVGDFLVREDLTQLEYMLENRTHLERGLQMAQRMADLDTPEEPDTGGQDPGFILSVVLCYLGIPPSLWKTVTEELLQAVWEEYRETYDEAAAQEKFRSYRRAFYAYSPFKILKLVLTFAVQGKIGIIPVRSEAARRLQAQIMKRLMAYGATEAGIKAVEAVLRKALLIVELAFLGGCMLLAFAEKLGQAVLALIEGMVKGIEITMEFGRIMGGLGRGILEQIFLQPLLVARATLDPANWQLSTVTPGLARDLQEFGRAIWQEIEGDDLDTLLAKQDLAIEDYPLDRALLQRVVDGINADMAAWGSGQQLTLEEVSAMTPLALVRFLHSQKLLTFVAHPETIADELLGR
ncbi:hypothetical protein FKZ61_012065 [Litorilinea aerophila]|uniref:Uncharacterized protein n=1 Tax=Litorilinea aerophila TaxID=1204385 RepID=A0A540VFT8_9CHLR|nr:hypothetical protein [Litorilinea aerophila]MCC9076843.1 hypothetical protein [Litorilinea aerophila]